jgi:hypothetical protein
VEGNAVVADTRDLGLEELAGTSRCCPSGSVVGLVEEAESV